ncbi:MAG: cysteine desulfurase family protein [Deinococcota bacterium]
MRFYYDYAATTPLDPRVFAVMHPYFTDHFANPASLHRGGQKVRAAVERAREQVANAINAQPRDIVFTSGATEADNHALRMVANAYPGGHIITSSIEHKAVLETAKQLEATGTPVTYLQPNARGEITVDALRAALRPDTCLVALMLVNNETGVITDIAAMSELAHSVGALMFCDAVQALGTVPVDVNNLGMDMLALSGHKVYGPKGVGVLMVREEVELKPFMVGGEQERGLRAGTLNVPAIVGMGEAAALIDVQAEAAKMASLRDQLREMLLEHPKLQGSIHLNVKNAPVGPKHLNIRIDDVDGEALLLGLDAEGIDASAGSACAAGTFEPSHVLTAMGLSREQARASVRLSLGRGVTKEMVGPTVSCIASVIERCRAAADTNLPKHLQATS